MRIRISLVGTVRGGGLAYAIFRKLDNRDLIHIATRWSLEDAFQLVAVIKPLCGQAEYLVKDQEGKQMSPFDESDA